MVEAAPKRARKPRTAPVEAEAAAVAPKRARKPAAGTPAAEAAPKRGRKATLAATPVAPVAAPKRRGKAAAPAPEPGPVLRAVAETAPPAAGRTGRTRKAANAAQQMRLFDEPEAEVLTPAPLRRAS